jgi:hypothetical protein
MSDIDPIMKSKLSKNELSEQELEKATGGGTNEKAGGASQS